MIGSEEVESGRGGIRDIPDKVRKKRITFNLLKFAQILDYDEIIFTEPQCLNLFATAPNIVLPAKRGPDFSAMIGFPVAGCSCDNLRAGCVTPKSLNDFVPQRRREGDRTDFMPTQRSLNRFIIHVVVGWDGAVISQKPDPDISG